MSEPIVETFTDERGNISVRVSQDVHVLTREEADRVASEYKRLKEENEHLREMSKFNYESSEFYRDRAHRLLVERDQLKAENDKLRELVKGLRYCAHEAYGMCARVPVGGERPFTCCSLYDFDAREYRCEKLMLELGVVVDE